MPWSERLGYLQRCISICSLSPLWANLGAHIDRLQTKINKLYHLRITIFIIYFQKTQLCTSAKRLVAAWVSNSVRWITIVLFPIWWGLILSLVITWSVKQSSPRQFCLNRPRQYYFQRMCCDGKPLHRIDCYSVDCLVPVYIPPVIPMSARILSTPNK